MKIQVILQHDKNDKLPGRYDAPANEMDVSKLQVEIVMPDGRVVEAVQRPAVGLVQNAIIIGHGERSGFAYEVSRGFIGVDPCDNDTYECLHETDSYEQAVAFGEGLAVEAFQPLVSYPEKLRCLYRPTEIVVEDGRGTCRYLLAGDAVRAESGEYNPLTDLGLKDSMPLTDIVDAVGAAWKVACRVTAQPMTVINGNQECSELEAVEVGA